MFGNLLNLFTERKTDAGFQALVDLGAVTAAKISVTPESALRCVPVFAAVRVRCETIGALPFLLYRRREDGGKDRASDHPLFRLIHDRPNPWTSAAEFVMQLEQDCLTDGGGYALANRSGEKVVELIRLPPRSVRVVDDEVTLEPRYEVTLKGGSKRVYPWRDILHVPTLGQLAAVQQAREAIGLCMSMERHAAGLFGNGARPSGILKFKRKLTEDVHIRLRQSWQSAHTGDNSGRTAILEDDGDFEPLTFNSVDLQFQEMRAFQVVEIARAFGVPPHLLMDFGRATWGNAEQMAQAFLTFTLWPRLKLWQGAVKRLMTPDEQAEYVPEFVVDALVQAEIAARFEAYSKAITNGILNPNEVRALENRPPYDDGDQFRASVNTTEPVSAEPQKVAA
ncbi:MAG: phage portal protein [bacterium]|nr:phage portal protein [bacterium]